MNGDMNVDTKILIQNKGDNMILEIEDYNGNTLCALSISELRENINDIEINNTIGND